MPFSPIHAYLPMTPPSSGEMSPHEQYTPPPIENTVCCLRSPIQSPSPENKTKQAPPTSEPEPPADNFQLVLQSLATLTNGDDKMASSNFGDSLDDQAAVKILPMLQLYNDTLRPMLKEQQDLAQAYDQLVGERASEVRELNNNLTQAQQAEYKARKRAETLESKDKQSLETVEKLQRCNAELRKEKLKLFHDMVDTQALNKQLDSERADLRHTINNINSLKSRLEDGKVELETKLADVQKMNDQLDEQLKAAQESDRKHRSCAEAAENATEAVRAEFQAYRIWADERAEQINALTNALRQGPRSLGCQEGEETLKRKAVDDADDGPAAKCRQM